MTNAYTTRDPHNAQGILIRTTPLESSSSNSGSNWQLFSLGVVALKRVETRMHDNLRGQASAELGQKPQSRYSTTFLTPIQAVALAGYQNKRRMVFWSRTTSKGEQHPRP